MRLEHILSLSSYYDFSQAYSDFDGFLKFLASIGVMEKTKAGYEVNRHDVQINEEEAKILTKSLNDLHIVPDLRSTNHYNVLTLEDSWNCFTGETTQIQIRYKRLSEFKP